MASQQQKGGERTFTFDDPLVALGIIIGIYIMGWMAWTFGHTHIAAAYVYLRAVQALPLYLVGVIAPDLPVASWVHGWVMQLCQPSGLIGLCQRDFSTVTWAEISASSMWVNGLWVVILVVACVRIFRVVDKQHPGLNFTRPHTIASFVRENKRAYPHLRLFGDLDLLAEPLDHPLFGMSQTSRQFAVHHRLIAGWQQDEDGTFTPTLDRKRAAEVFRSQLGRLWTHDRALSEGEALLMAIAMPRAAATDTSLDDAAFNAALADSDRMVVWCWDQFAPSESRSTIEERLRPAIDLTLAHEVIGRYIDRPVIREVLRQHAFTRTILVALFMQARRLGVLPPAEVRWMRFFDRDLWYLVENMGRQGGYAEGAAALSHYLYESRARSGIPEAQVDKAVTALDQAMCAFRYDAADRQRYEGSPPAGDVQTA